MNATVLPDHIWYNNILGLTFHSWYVPDGSVWYNLGVPSKSKPIISAESPKGRRPLLCVYFWKLKKKTHIQEIVDFF